MSCRQAFDIDLAAFLAEPRAAAFDRFRAHYPTCPDCTAEVRAWTDVHLALAAGGGDAHAEPAALLAFDENDVDLDPARRAAIEAHLAGCETCRDEIAALHRADRMGLTAGAPEPAVAFSAASPGLPDEPAVEARPPGILDRLRAVVLHPAFAYALVLLLLYPAVRGVREAEQSRPVETATPAASTPAAPGASEAPAPRVVESQAAPAPPPAEPSAPRGFGTATGAAPTQAREAPAPAAAAPAAPASPAPAPPAAERRMARDEARLQSAEPAGESYAAPAGGARAARAAPGGVLTLRADETTLVNRAGLPAMVTIRLPAMDGASELRLVAEDGRREIRERVLPPPDGRAEMTVPSAWLTPGRYAAEVRAIGADAPVAAYAITVR